MVAIETATFLFTDLVGSTALSHSVSPSEAEVLRRDHFRLLRSAVDTTGGHEVKNLGDGLMVVFTSASRALACATAMQQAVERSNRRAATSLGLRVGVAMGEASDEDGDFFGDPVVEAARLCAAAAGGQVLVTDAVRAVVGRHASQSLRPLGPLELKGLPGPVEVVELAWEPAPCAGAVPIPSRLVASAPEATFGFIGRSEELAEIAAALKEALSSSQSGLLLLGGEPGIGKTGLAAQAARRAHESGAVVTFGACEEGLGVAFHPWLTAVGHLVEHLPDGVLSELRATHLAALRRLLPHLGDRLPAAGELTADVGAERFLLLDAVAALLAAASEPDGLVVVLDDLQWADLASLQVLTHLVRSPIPTRALIVGSFRPGDLGSSHPLSGFLADVRGEARVRRRDLAGLGDDEVVVLIETAAGHRLDEASTGVAHALRRETGGNPFFMVELLRHLGESGAIVQDPSGQYRLRDDVSELALPASVKEVVGRRVRRLGDEAVRILSLASVVGQEFDLEVLAAVADRGEDDLLDLLDAAAGAALVSELDEPPGRYRFSHALVQSTLYSELGPARRQRAHQRVAAFLETRPLPGEAASVAHHLLAAIRPADVDKAVDYAERAGDEALAALAPADAAAWYSRALDALDRGGPSDPRRRAELRVALAEALSYAGQNAFKETLAAATPDVLASGDTELLVRAALVRLPGSFSSPVDADPDQVRLIELALEAVGPADSPTRARLLAALGDEYGMSQAEQWARLGTEAMEMAVRLGDDATLLAVYGLGASALRLPDRLEQRLEWDALLRPLVAATPDVSVRLFGLVQEIMTAAELLDWDDIDRITVEMERCADAVDLDLFRWEPLMVRAWTALTRCSLDEGERLALEAFQAGQRAGVAAAVPSFGAQLMMHRLYSGRLEEMLADPSLVEVPMPSLAVGWRLAMVWLWFQSGQIEKASAIFSEQAPKPAQIPFDTVWLQAVAQLGDCAVYVGDVGLAEECYRLLLPYAERFWYSGSHDIGYLARYLGRMAALLGRRDEADAHLRYSLHMHHEKGLPYWEARSALDLAELVWDDDPGEAAELIGVAAELAARYGLGGLPFPERSRR